LSSLIEDGPSKGSAARTDRTASVGGGVLSVSSVSHRFRVNAREEVEALRDVSLELDSGEFVSIVGPSGCGKSTLLSIAAGLIRPTSGTIEIDHSDVTGTCGHVGYMLQRDLLLQWRTVLDNACLVLDIQGESKAESRRKATELLARFALVDFANRYPSSLSGGMRQRVAFIRTLLSGKSILLLDEPLGALDAQTRALMQEWLLDVWAQFGKTVLFITHDIDEAVFLSDRVAVMSARPGRILDVVDIRLARPRDAQMRLAPEFIEARSRIMEQLRGESLKAIEASE
jgi:ABC-type nitrate/sulfonate/bicarbonate transport system ATPase subunit